MKNPFVTLKIGPEVLRGRSDDFITAYLDNLRRFYRRQLHPDVAGNKSATEFRAMEEAFETLADPKDFKYWKGMLLRSRSERNQDEKEQLYQAQDERDELMAAFLSYIRSVGGYRDCDPSSALGLKGVLYKMRDELSVRFAHSNSQGMFVPSGMLQIFDLEFNEQGIGKIHLLEVVDYNPFQEDPLVPDKWVGLASATGTVVNPHYFRRNGTWYPLDPVRIIGSIPEDGRLEGMGRHDLSGLKALMSSNISSEEYHRSKVGFSLENFRPYLPVLTSEIIPGSSMIGLKSDPGGNPVFTLVGKVLNAFTAKEIKRQVDRKKKEKEK